MELKRYVLLNGYNLILDSKNKEELRVVHYEDGDVLKVVVDKWYYPLEKLDYKTSDNILDLVEVGDLIRTLYDGTLLEVGAIENGIFYQKKYSLKTYFDDVKEVYKRQPNGDYKRYEVK